jgi:hypothetical protein
MTDRITAEGTDELDPMAEGPDFIRLHIRKAPGGDRRGL